MAIGRDPSYNGGVFAPADVAGAGNQQWASVAGVSPDHPLVSEGGEMPYNIARSRSRIVTTPAGQSGAAATGGLVATPDGAGIAHLDSWRDVFNFKGSPAPWVLILMLGILFFAHLSVQARAGVGRKKAALSAALG